MPKSVDENQLAARILWAATNTVQRPDITPQQRLEHAARAYRASAHMEAKTPEELSALGKKAAVTRWGEPAITADNLPMATRPKNLDPNQLAKRILDEATGEEPKTTPEPQKNRAAQELGRLGGKKGGEARKQSLSPERRSEIAKKAAAKRWTGKQ